MKIIERVIILKKHKYNDFKTVISKTAFLSRELLMSYLETTYSFNITVTKESIINFTKQKNDETKNELLFFSNKSNYTEGLYSLEVIDVFFTEKKFHLYHKPKASYKRKEAEVKSKVFKEDEPFWKVVLTPKKQAAIGLARNKKSLKFFYYGGTFIDVTKFDFYDIKLKRNEVTLSVTHDFIINKCSYKTLRTLKSKLFIENIDFVVKYFENNDEKYADIKV